MVPTFNMPRTTLYRFSRSWQSRTLLILKQIQIINSHIPILSVSFDSLENNPIINTTRQSFDFNLAKLPSVLNLSWVIKSPNILRASSFIQNLNFEFLDGSVAMLHKSHFSVVLAFIFKERDNLSVSEYFMRLTSKLKENEKHFSPSEALKICLSSAVSPSFSAFLASTLAKYRIL